MHTGAFRNIYQTSKYNKPLSNLTFNSYAFPPSEAKLSNVNPEGSSENSVDLRRSAIDKGQRQISPILRIECLDMTTRCQSFLQECLLEA